MTYKEFRKIVNGSNRKAARVAGLNEREYMYVLKNYGELKQLIENIA